MKLKFSILLLFLLLLAGIDRAHAQTTTNLFNYQAVTGTTTTNGGASIQVGGVYIPAKKLIIQNGGLNGGATNVLTVNEQISFDNVNWATVATYNPPTTNATVDTFSPTLSAQTIYIRAQIITQTNFSVGVLAQ